MPRPGVAAALFFLGILAIYYRLIPYLSSTTDSLTSSIVLSLHQSLSPPSFCTKEVGEGICCELHLAAEPCLDECRKTFVDRVTFRPTKEYDECADQCLLLYRATCGKQNEVQEARDVQEEKTKQEVPRVQRRRRSQV